MLKTRDIQQAVKTLKAQQDELAKVRDKLREIKDEFDSLQEAAGDAWESLDAAIDRLSELV